MIVMKSALRVLALCAVSTLAFAQAPVRVQGEVVRLDGQKLAVKTASGAVNEVTLADPVRIQRRVPITLDQVKPGVFLGTTAAPGPDGTLVASEVHVFPEALRGTGEGHRPFGADNRSSRTNGPGQ